MGLSRGASGLFLLTIRIQSTFLGRLNPLFKKPEELQGVREKLQKGCFNKAGILSARQASKENEEELHAAIGNSQAPRCPLINISSDKNLGEFKRDMTKMEDLATCWICGD